jgi:hypothetical protein
MTVLKVLGCCRRTAFSGRRKSASLSIAATLLVLFSGLGVKPVSAQPSGKSADAGDDYLKAATERYTERQQRQHPWWAEEQRAAVLDQSGQQTGARTASRPFDLRIAAPADVSHFGDVGSAHPWGDEDPIYACSFAPLTLENTYLQATPPESEEDAKEPDKKAAKPGVGPIGGHKGAPNLAENATNPTSNLMQFQIQNSFVPSSFNSSGYSHTVDIQPVIPYKLFDHLNILRLTIPITLTPDFDGPVNETSGLGDTSLLNLMVFPFDWGNIAAGFNLAFPTATDARLGSGKWQAGPAIAAIYTKIPKWQIGALVFNNWSYATNRSGKENVNKMAIQYIIIRHFEKGWYAGWGDLAMEFNWRNGKQNLPLCAKVGKIVHIGKVPFNIFVQPFYTVAHDGPTPEWGVKLNVTLLLPEG